MKRKTTFFTIVGLGLSVLIFGGALLLTKPLVDAAEQYFLLISQNEIEQAYQLTADEVRAEFSLEDFQEINKNSLLKKYVAASWSSRTIENDTGQLLGTVTTSDPAEQHLNVAMELVKKNGQWKIYSVDLW